MSVYGDLWANSQDLNLGFVETQVFELDDKPQEMNLWIRCYSAECLFLTTQIPTFQQPDDECSFNGRTKECPNVTKKYIVVQMRILLIQWHNLYI